MAKINKIKLFEIPITIIVFNYLNIRTIDKNY